MAQHIESITLTMSSLLSNAKEQIALVAKHAKDGGGGSLYSYLTISSRNEEKVLLPLFYNAAQKFVSILAPVSGTYSQTSGNINFSIVVTDRYSNQYQSEATHNNQNILPAVKESIENYIVTDAISQYFNSIHPMTGEKYPPLWGAQYTERANSLLATIQQAILTKRQPFEEAHTYADINGQINN